MITSKAGLQVFGLEFVIWFAVSSLIGGILSSKSTRYRIRNAIVAYLGQMAIAATLSIFGYLVANVISAIGRYSWTDTMDWAVGRWLTIAVVTIFYAKSVVESRKGPELKPGFVAGRCGGNPRKWT